MRLAVPDANSLASGLMARFEAFRLPPEIEAESIHSNSEVVEDFLKSSKTGTGLTSRNNAFKCQLFSFDEQNSLLLASWARTCRVRK
ncbi:hypothetical protein SAMN05428953_102116 [Mesorhizobium muleiense]|uniref:Uncharacterized protein n=1 Tax=Mesorhizobium muleiense TaxID=1004279 RepID=A0A1G8L205_9HYPH|nr:hypothetical protein SAMN05428953_102116 [Mesorhizobium muleiense]